ncbi:MAG TPA: formate dehydrogenase accessory protein FdhE [Syntrophomonadaceae bacterium]|nr:formate dehydrogenase accessory protein FdhE [Syntrophomonadaceae bacterium]
MDIEKSKQNSAGNEMIEDAYQKYKKLRQIVKEWQQEKGGYCLENLELANKPPYLSVQDIPLTAFIELWQQLNNFSEIAIGDSELRQLWDQVKMNENTSTDEINQKILLHLQMAVSGVAQLVTQKIKEENLKTTSTNDNELDNYKDVSCPICAEIPTLTVLEPPNGNRVIHCNMCNYEWQTKRIGCIYCGNTEAKKQMYLNNEDFPGVEVVVCKVCGKSFKEIDARQLLVEDFMWEDLRTIELNFATELWLENNMPDNKIH